MWFDFFLWALGGIQMALTEDQHLHYSCWFQAEAQRTIFLWSVGCSGNSAQNGCFIWKKQPSVLPPLGSLRNASSNDKCGEEQLSSFILFLVSYSCCYDTWALISQIHASDHNKWICNQGNFLLTGPDADGWRWVQIAGISKFWESLCTIASEWSGYCKWEARTQFYQLIVHFGNHLTLEDLDFPFFKQVFLTSLKDNPDYFVFLLGYWVL